MPLPALATRILGIVLSIVVVGVFLGSASVLGQDSEREITSGHEAPVATLEAVRPSAHITVLGGALLGSPTVSPIRQGDCRISERNAVDQAAKDVTQHFVIVENLACSGATMTEVIRDQLPQVERDTDTIIVGGMSLEFDWPALATACLVPQSQSIDGCRSQANLARADAANTALLWQSFLDQAQRIAPRASLVIVAPPTPVSAAPFPLGHPCCADVIDVNSQVRGVFDLARSLRDSTIEGSTGDTTVISTNDEFDGHRLDDARPWLNNSPHSIGAPTAEGTAVIASLLGMAMPTAELPPEIPVVDSDIVLIVSPPSSRNDLVALADSIPGWFDQFARADTRPHIRLLHVGAEAELTTLPEDERVRTQSATVEVFTSADLLAQAIVSGADSEEAVSLAELAAAIGQADDLLSGPINRRSIVARVGDLSEQPGDGEALAVTFSNAVASVEITSPSPQSVLRLRQLAASTNVNIRFVSTSRLDSSLPTPQLSPAAIAGVEVPRSVELVLGKSSIIDAKVDVHRPLDIEVTWLRNEQVIGVGQRLDIDGTTIGVGKHLVDVVVRGAGHQARSTSEFSVTLDGDGFDDDLCESTFDETISDADGDGHGASCDDDDDGDGVPDAIDPCPQTANQRLTDTDLDGLPNNCDAEPANGPSSDLDGDGFPNLVDNCPTVPSTGQSDDDNDGIGGVCEEGTIDPVCTIIGTDGDDYLVGTPEADIICGLGGDDVIVGRAGNDVIFGGTGDDVIGAGEGHDIIYGGSGSDEISGGDRSDLILGERGDDTIDGGNGNDIIGGGRGADRVDGGIGGDVIFGGGGDDRLRGGDGADTIDGQSGSDRIAGGVGADVLRGGPGIDSVRGGMGNDTLIGLQDNDSYVAGNGVDLIDLGAVRSVGVVLVD